VTANRAALLTAGPTARAAASLERDLVEAAPELVTGLRDQLPLAADTVARRVAAAAYRERLWDRRHLTARGLALPLADGPGVVAVDRHAFDRVEPTRPLLVDPAALLERLGGGSAAARAVAAEVADACVNLALARARRAVADVELATRAAGTPDSLALAATLDADTQALFFERLATEGHNLHPCGRTRLGWSPADVLAHDLESPGTTVGFVGVRRDLHVGDDIGRMLELESTLDPRRYAITPVHAWQLDRIVRTRYADLVADRALVPLPDSVPAWPTAALRTLLLSRDRTGKRRYLKVSLDIQVTSTRRTISVASTRNGPVLSRLLARLLADEPRLLLLAETAGSATIAPGGRERDLAAILRSGLSGRLATGEIAVPGGALSARSPITGTPVVAELVTRFGRTRGLTDRPAAALAFVTEYARLLLPPVLRLATRHGIGLEAHLQNCVPTFVDGVPHRLALRDFAGLRLHPPRLNRSPRLWPGSVVVTADATVMLAKVAYTALQAHLGEIVVRLVGSHGLAETAAWAAVRAVVDETYEELRAEPALAARVADDHALLTGPTVPHKALLTMRLAAADGYGADIYARVENPLR
jgi:D-ornithine---citrate ligase